MMRRWKGIWRPPGGHKGAMPWGVGPIKLHIAHPISSLALSTSICQQLHAMPSSGVKPTRLHISVASLSTSLAAYWNKICMGSSWLSLTIPVLLHKVILATIFWWLIWLMIKLKIIGRNVWNSKSGCIYNSTPSLNQRKGEVECFANIRM